ncbi:g10665 [Coccomyxa elongata]
MQRSSSQNSAVSSGTITAILVLVIVNLVQLNLLYFGTSSSLSCYWRGRKTSSTTDAKMATPATLARRINEGRRGAEPRYALFVIYSWNYEVLLTAVEGYQAAGFGKSLIIIDNSPDRDIVGDERIRDMVGEVIATRARLTFSQSQNYIADIAIERDYAYYFWGHSDVVVFPQNTTTSFAEVAVACAEAAMSAKPNWGIMYFMYDWFSAIRTDLVRQVQYDTFITVYMSDCDFYPRVRAAGFETIEYHQALPNTEVKVYDLHAPVKVPWNDFTAAKEILDAHENDNSSRFDWKLHQMGVDEKVGWDLWEHSSYLYFRAKWGEMQDPTEICKIEVESPLTGQKVLPQQPFGSVAHLQKSNWLDERSAAKYGVATLRGVEMRDPPDLPSSSGFPQSEGQE